MAKHIVDLIADSQLVEPSIHLASGCTVYDRETCEDVKGHWAKKARSIFRQYPRALLVIISDRKWSSFGFETVGRHQSPIFFYRKSSSNGCSKANWRSAALRAVVPNRTKKFTQGEDHEHSRGQDSG